MAKRQIHLLIGNEVFLRRQRLEELVKQHLPDGFSDFNYVRIDAKETSLVDILSAWEERSFGGGHRVIHVENAGQLKVKTGDKIADVFLSRAEKGTSHATLILESESVDRRKPLFKKLAKLAATEEFKPLREYEVPGFIMHYAKARGYVVDPEAAEFLGMFASSELMVISSELDKLMLFIGEDRTRITVDDVRELLMPSRNYSLFDLQDALGAGNGEKAFRALDGLLEEGTAPIMLWRFLGNLLERTWRISRATTREDLQKISTSSYYQNKLQDFSRRFPPDRLEKVVVGCRKLEMASRRGTLAPPFYLRQLVQGVLEQMR